MRFLHRTYHIPDKWYEAIMEWSGIVKALNSAAASRVCGLPARPLSPLLFAICYDFLCTS